MLFISKSQKKGALGEDYACEYLKDNGYKIVARNVTFGKKELDIVATKEAYIAFVEVKTRRADEKTRQRYGSPAKAVTAEKLENIRLAANAFLTKYKSSVKDLIPRIDVIEVLLLPTDDKDEFIPFDVHHIINVRL